MPPLQQKNAMQNSLKKIQQEMAELEAVLKQNGSQSCEVLPVCRELPPSSTEGTFEMEQTRKERNRSMVLFGVLGFFYVYFYSFIKKKTQTLSISELLGNYNSFPVAAFF